MNIYQKLLEVMKNVQYLKKDDNVEFGNTKYKAMSEEKVTQTLREELVKQGLVVFPIEQTCNRVGNITHVDVKYRMVNAENPDEYIEIASAGDGADTQDKGSGKAMTYAFKYMFLRTFAIPTGDDPDKISSDQLDAEEAERKRKEAEALKKPIGKDQGEILKRLSENAGLKADKILKYYGVKDWPELTGEQYGMVMQQIRIQEEKNGAQSQV